jgi:hypothetical protein
MDFMSPSHWHWWTFAVGLLVLEMLAPGTFFLWPAIVAAILGIVIWLVPQIAFEYQLFIFSVVSIISVVAGRYYLVKHPPTSDQPFLNQRGSEYVGRTLTLTEAIKNGIGRIRIGDSSWRVEGPDCPTGTLIEVIGIEGTRLQVRPLPSNVVTLETARKADPILLIETLPQEKKSQ